MKNPGSNKTYSETVSQGGKPSGASQSNQSGPPLAECITCGRKHTGVYRLLGVTCFKCGQKGHYSDKCPLTDTNTNKDIKCYQCGKLGHIVEDCRSDGSSTTRQSVAASNRPTTRVFNMTLGNATAGIL